MIFVLFTVFIVQFQLNTPAQYNILAAYIQSMFALKFAIWCVGGFVWISKGLLLKLELFTYTAICIDLIIQI